MTINYYAISESNFREMWQWLIKASNENIIEKYILFILYSPAACSSLTCAWAVQLRSLTQLEWIWKSFLAKGLTESHVYILIIRDESIRPATFGNFFPHKTAFFYFLYWTNVSYHRHTVHYLLSYLNGIDI